MVMQKISLEENQSENLVQQNIEHLKQIFPEVFSEGKVNFETLRQLLSDQQVLDEGEEKYGLNWHGKKKARQSALTPSLGTLLPCPDESVDWDNTQNLFIEGDNLEVLKLLQKSYANKIQLIYIDPPYNTGNIFDYPDNYKDNLSYYLRYTKQIDDNGLKESSSIETNGKVHTKWLNMIYPRLLLARNLLKQDGLIAISIDDNEIFNLGKLMDELFGENNRLACAPWLSEASGGKEKTGLRTGHEYILIYVKNDSSSISSDVRSTGELDLRDSIGQYRKGRELMKWGGTSLRSDRPKQFYKLRTPSGEWVEPYRNDGQEGHWRWGRENPKIKEALDNPEFFHWEKRPFDNGVMANGEVERWVPYEKIRDVKKSVGWSTWLDKYGTNADATRELKSLCGEKFFDTPKPTSLIKWLINLHADDDGIILDFFAGSCSTAHAVLSQNQEDHGNRRFICVQIPEKIETKIVDKVTLSNIAEIGKFRIRKVIENNSLNQGFKVFKLAQSNIQPWNPDPTDLEATLLESENHLIEGRTEQDILYELLLKRGIDLATPITERKVAEKTVYSIGYGATFACLDEHIQAIDIESIAQLIIDWYQELAPGNKPHIFFRDSAFENDVVKTNIAAILQQNGLDHVRSL